MKHLDRAIQPNDCDMNKAYDNAEREAEYIAKLKTRYKPEDIFDYADLECWAKSNGWILPDTNNNTQTKDY